MTNLSSLVEAIAKQALGNGQQQTNQNNNASSGGLGGILGSVLGQVMNQSNQQQANNNQSQPNTNSSQSGLGGILGSVLGQLGGAQSKQSSGLGSSKTALLMAVLPVVLAWVQKQGGIQGAIDKLKKSGLGNQAQSWVDPNAVQNDSIDESQVQQLFNDDDIDKIAEQTQQPKQDIYSAIATVLPQIIDSLTPKGNATDKGEANQDIQNVLNSISGFLKR